MANSSLETRDVEKAENSNNDMLLQPDPLINRNLLEEPRDFVPNEVIVKFRPGVELSERASLQESLDTSVIETTQTLDIQLWEVNNGLSVEETIDILASNPEVEYAEPNFVVSTADIFPNDSRFDELWGLNNTEQTGGILDADIDAPEAWDIQTGSGDIVIGVIDTGVDYTHPDLDDNMWTNPGEIPNNGIDDDDNGFVDDYYGYDFVNEDGDPFDDNGHGTHVAGTIAAEGNNDIGVTGVNWDAKIMGIKFLDSGGFGSYFDAIQAVEYSTLMGVPVTNNSWRGYGFSQGLYDAIAAAGEQGQLFVAAAGNESNDNDNPDFRAYPASFDLDNIIAVAATDDSDRLASFSNFGTTSVDLGAPGVEILSTIPGNDYAFFSGTSMATPHVVGVVSLLLAEEPGLSAEEVKELILENVDLISALEGITVTEGRLNAFKALDKLGPPIELIGTEGDDFLTGSNRRDIISGLGGDDILQGLGGNDQIFGDDGNDLIAAGDGNDTVEGNAGRDDIVGGDGNDLLEGGAGVDRILGESGDDLISGGSDRDVVDGGGGNDFVSGDGENDRLFGGAGDDSLTGGAGADTLTGGFDNDILEGGDGDDRLLGIDLFSPGAEVGFGAGEVDTLTGAAGEDIFLLGDENHVYYDDGDSLTRGDSDFALLTDFDSGEDFIQLQGSAEFYSLDFFTSGAGTIDADLVFDPGATARGEVIAVLQDVSTELSFDDPAFVFV